MADRKKDFGLCITMLASFMLPAIGDARPAAKAAAPASITITWDPMGSRDPCELGPELKVYEDRAYAAREIIVQTNPDKDPHSLTATVPVNRTWGRLTITAFEAQGESTSIYFAQPASTVIAQMRAQGVRFERGRNNDRKVVNNYPEVDSSGAVVSAAAGRTQRSLGRSRLYCGLY
jgi:hypothetical protein